MKKVTVDLKVKLLIHCDEDVDIQEVIDEMDYSFLDKTTKADIQDSSIEDFEVVDSR